MSKLLRIADAQYVFNDTTTVLAEPDLLDLKGSADEGNRLWAMQYHLIKVHKVHQSNSHRSAMVQSLYQSYRQEICNYLISKFRLDQSEAEDVVQSAFIRLTELPNLEEIENHRAFLYKMCGNMVLDSQRHKKVTHSYASSMASDEEAYTNIGPEEVADSTQRLGLLARALWNMPGKRRELLMMSRFDGLSYAEIARRVGLSETVVRKHISKALADCHKALQ